jgi:hypothetical protein
MICTLVPGTPACAKTQDTAEGNGFFSVARAVNAQVVLDESAESDDQQTAASAKQEQDSGDANNTSTTNSLQSAPLSNMPPNFDFLLPDAVIHMGLHAMDMSKSPASPEEWINPSYLMCSYSSQIVAVEPMFPFAFTSGSEDRFFEEVVQYVSPTVNDLPTYWSADYHAGDQMTTFTMIGASNLCHGDFGSYYEKFPQQGDGTNNTNNGQSSSSSMSWRLLWGVPVSVFVVLWQL